MSARTGVPAQCAPQACTTGVPRTGVDLIGVIGVDLIGVIGVDLIGVVGVDVMGVIGVDVMGVIGVDVIGVEGVVGVHLTGVPFHSSDKNLGRNNLNLYSGLSIRAIKFVQVIKLQIRVCSN
jgi:hypothetical protein